jgi:hypothetical protein
MILYDMFTFRNQDLVFLSFISKTKRMGRTRLYSVRKKIRKLGMYNSYSVDESDGKVNHGNNYCYLRDKFHFDTEKAFVFPYKERCLFLKWVATLYGYYYKE